MSGGFLCMTGLDRLRDDRKRDHEAKQAINEPVFHSSARSARKAGPGSPWECPAPPEHTEIISPSDRKPPRSPGGSNNLLFMLNHRNVSKIKPRSRVKLTRVFVFFRSFFIESDLCQYRTRLGCPIFARVMETFPQRKGKICRFGW